MDSKDIFEEVKCPICFELPEDKIFLCKNGHAICELCLVGVKLCPICRVSYNDGKVRNRTMETLLDSFRIKCTFSDLGCTEELSRKDVKNHALNCKFNGKCVKLCGDIGFRCDFMINLMDIASAAQHLSTRHNAILRNDLYFSMDLKHFAKATTQKTKRKHVDSIWTPIFIDYANIRISQNQPTAKTSFKPYGLLVLSFIHGKDKSASWMLVRLSDDKQGQQYHAQFEIKSQSKEVSTLSWRVPAINVTEISTMATQAPFRIPNNLLLQHYTNQTNGTLSVAVKIVPLMGKIEKPRMSLETSTLVNTLIRQYGDVPPTFEQFLQQLGAQSREITCQECGSCPLAEVQYRRLYSSGDNSVCNNCVAKETPENRWYAIIRKPKHDQNHVSNLWKNRQEEWKSSGKKDYVFQGMDELCSSEGCVQHATYTCLECRNIDLCKDCTKHFCVNHLLAVFVIGTPDNTIGVSTSVEPFKEETVEDKPSQATAKPLSLSQALLILTRKYENCQIASVKCNDCKAMITGVHYQSLQTADFYLCSDCINKTEYMCKWFAFITVQVHADAADDLWVEKIIEWSSSGVWPLQNSTVCSSTRGCSEVAKFACLQCDTREHYCVCESCFMNKDFDDKKHLFARYASEVV